MSFSGSKKKSGDKTSSSSSTSQNYSLGFNKALTKALRVSGDLRASQSQSKSGGKTTKNTSIRPSVFFNLANPYFGFTGGYQSNFLPLLSLEDKVESSSWNTNFSTTPKGFPSLRLSFDQATSKDDLEVHIVNSEQSSVNISTNYNIFDVGLVYNFLRSETNDFVSQAKQESPRHMGTANFTDTLFNGKVSYGLNFGASSSSSKNTSLSGTPTIFDDKKETLTGLFDTDTTPVDNQLSDSSSLIDGSTVATATLNTGGEIDLNSSFRNIGFKLKEKKTINKIFLYVSTTETTLNPSDFGWDVYSSNVSTGDLWTRISTGVTITFNTTNNRFEFELPSSIEAVFFKVVNRTTDALLDKINVTEIEAIGSVSETPSVVVTRSSDRQFGGISFSWKINDKINTSYSLSHDRSEELPQGTESRNTSQGITLNYAPSKKLSMFLGFQKQGSQTTGNPDSGSNNYSLTISTNPIETINGSISLNRNESLQDGEIKSKGNSANLNTFYKLYPGIDLGTGFSLNLSESDGTKTKTMSSNWNFNLVPWKKLNMIIDGSLTGSKSEKDGLEVTSSSKSLRSVVNFSPSRHLNFSVSLDLLPKLKQNLSIQTRLPGDLQLNFNYSRSNEGVEAAGSSISWNISRYLYLNSSYNKTFLNNVTDDTSSSYSISISIRK